MVEILSIKWLNDLTNVFINIGESHKYLNFFIGMFLESTGIPFASMPAFASTGYLLSEGKFNFWWAVLIGGLGNALGSTVSYCLGYFFGNIVRRKRKSHKLAEREERLQSYIEKYGTKTIFFAQLIGFARVFISFPAGLLKMDFKKFFVATLLGGMIFVIYFSLVTTHLIGLYEKFVYPYIGLSFLSFGFLVGLFYATTHVSLKIGKRVHKKYQERKNGKDN